jgi:LuxR family maltose regulon positive regulatory protein
VPAKILSTKLFIPPPRKDLVSRPRLLDALRQGSISKLTMISAPAGYGKTTLLSEWIDLQGMPFGWLSLDSGDNDIDRFQAYLIASLSSIPIDIGEGIIEDFGSKPDNSIEARLIPLINRISLTDGHFALVLDDYYLIHDEKVHETVSYILDNLPSQMHLVIATRTDPPLRLSQLRAQGELCEIRAKELRFTDQEAIQFLNQSMNLELASDDIVTLSQKTEGWIAGLQLAAISLHGNQDKQAFVRTFAGDDRYIADYLLDEALSRQPSHIQSFLLQTSILDRLCAPLCNAVTGRNDSQTILASIEQANLFMVPLDNQRTWFRYHHLFADLLNNRLRQFQAGEISNYHKFASTWYQANDLQTDAINHALAAEDLDLIVQLTEEMAVYSMDYRDANALLTWLQCLPESAFQENPWLQVTRSWALFNTGEYESVEMNLIEIERSLTQKTIAEELATRIQGHIAAIRSYLAELREEPVPAMQQAEDSLGMLAEKDVRLKAFVEIRLANGLAWFGDLDRAIALYKAAGESSKLVGDGQLAITALSEMAVVQMFHGHLRESIKSITDINHYAQSLVQRDGRRLPAMGILYRHNSHIKRELNELSEAVDYAAEGVKICQRWGDKESLAVGLLALARAQFAQGESEKAAQNVREMMRVVGQISPMYESQLRTWQLRFQLVQGDTEDTRTWVRELGISAEDEIRYECQHEYHNLVLYLTAVGEYTQALELSRNILMVVTAAGDQVLKIQHHVLGAIILEKIGKQDDALDAMAEALSLASGEGYVRAILDQGEPVIRLLYLAAQEGIQPAYSLQLIQEFEQVSPSAVRVLGRSTELVEGLSEREVEVLNLIAKGSTNQEIAQELILSLYTVKSHARNIYSKLGVKNRTEAVARARRIGLLSQE